jgi:hypothetical protein
VRTASSLGTPLEWALRYALPGTDVKAEIVRSDRTGRAHESLAYLVDEATA